MPFLLLAFFVQCSMVFVCKHYGLMAVVAFNMLLCHYKKRQTFVNISSKKQAKSLKWCQMSKVQLKSWFSTLDGPPDERDAPCRQSKEVTKIMKTPALGNLKGLWRLRCQAQWGWLQRGNSCVSWDGLAPLRDIGVGKRKEFLAEAKHWSRCPERTEVDILKGTD